MRVTAVQIQSPLWIYSRPDCNQDHRSRQTGNDKKSLACHFYKFMFLSDLWRRSKNISLLSDACDFFIADFRRCRNGKSGKYRNISGL
nr:MAG TPA: hypothetical protein [Bacteriophage sp.]